MERKLNDQWVEELDGKKHVYKCIGLNDDMSEIIKDLGILNEDGCLPSDFGMYPEVYEHVLMGINGYMVKAYGKDPHVGKYAWGETKQEAIDAWNRRT